MRGSLAISTIVHLVALGMCLVALAAQPMEAPATPTMAVNTISVKDFTELTKGVKDTPKLKVDDIKPLADKIDTPKPVDEVAPKIADNKPEIKTDTSAQQQPKPDPKPDPKPADKPAKAKPPDYKPDKIADLLKKDAAKQPQAGRQGQPRHPAARLPKFNADQVAALLDKRDPQRQMAAAETLNSQPNLGASNGTAAQLSQSEIDALARAHFQLLEPAGRHQRVDPKSMSCFASCSSRTARWRKSRCWSRPQRRRSGRRLAESAKRALLLVPAIHHAQARALRPVERPRAQIRSARAARWLRRLTNSTHDDVFCECPISSVTRRRALALGAARRRLDAVGTLCAAPSASTSPRAISSRCRSRFRISSAAPTATTTPRSASRRSLPPT